MKKKIFFVVGIILILLAGVIIITAMQNKKEIITNQNDKVRVDFKQVADETTLTKAIQEKISKLKGKKGNYILDEGSENIIMISKGNNVVNTGSVKVLSVARDISERAYNINITESSDIKSETVKKLYPEYSYVIIKIIGDKADYLIIEDNNIVRNKAIKADVAINNINK